MSDATFAALQQAGSTDPKAVAEALKHVKVSDIPHLVTEFVPQDDGLVFHEGQAKLPTLAAPVWTAATNKATFDFSPSPIANSSYQATMSAAGVTDVAGNPLPANSVLPFFFLGGDGNRSKTVEITDFNTLATFFGKSGQPFSNGNYDYSADGVISITDFNILATFFGFQLLRTQHPGNQASDQEQRWPAKTSKTHQVLRNW